MCSLGEGVSAKGKEFLASKSAADIARKFIQFKVGDGRSIYLWFDWWHSEGVLDQKFGHRIVNNAGSKVANKLSYVLRGRDWCWMPARSDDLVYW